MRLLHAAHRERLARLIALDVEHAVVVHRDEPHALLARHRLVAGGAPRGAPSPCAVAPQPSAMVIFVVPARLEALRRCRARTRDR